MVNENLTPVFWGAEAKQKANCKNNKHILLEDFKLFSYTDSWNRFYTNGKEELEEIRSRNRYETDRDNHEQRLLDYMYDRHTNQEEQVSTNTKHVSAMDAMTSFLKFYKDYVVNFIVQREMKERVSRSNKVDFLSKYKFKFVFTIPAMCDTSARESLIQSAIQANIIRDGFRHRLSLVDEHKAAIIFCEKELRQIFESDKSEEQMRWRNIIVLDAGNLTVNASTYQWEVSPGKDQEREINQIGDRMGDLCGSKFLDIRYKKYLLQINKNKGVNLSHISSDEFNNLLLQFSNKFKVLSNNIIC